MMTAAVSLTKTTPESICCLAILVPRALELFPAITAQVSLPRIRWPLVFDARWAGHQRWPSLRLADGLDKVIAARTSVLPRAGEVLA